MKSFETNINVPSIAASSVPQSSSTSSATLSAKSTYMVQTENTESLETALKSKGYQYIQRFSNSLQGSIWKVSRSKKGPKYIIKATQKTAHYKHIACVSGQEIQIKENILTECAILKGLTNHNPPSLLAKFVDFFDDSCYYYLCMEFGGENLFGFVKTSHEIISRGLLPVDVWLLFCKSAMLQIAHFIHWMHDTMHCCHLDISLENLVIDNVSVMLNQDTNKIDEFSDFQIKIIDFGVAEAFHNSDFQCIKYVGKTSYKAPEVYEERHIFDARSADCWSLGVTFFMMIFGCPPFAYPSREDPLYSLIIDGQIETLLNEWNLIQFSTKHILHLFRKIFVLETNRINIKEIQKLLTLL